MWNDFLKTFETKIKNRPFEQVMFYISELKAWIDWQDKDARFRAELAGAFGFVVGLVVGISIVLFFVWS